MWVTLFRETLKGKSLHRTLTNLRFQRVLLNGHGLDLGAKDGRSSYYRFLRQGAGERPQIVFTDLHPRAPNVLQVDLEQQIPVPQSSQDFLLLMFVLEHLYDYRTCLAECYRVLKPGGQLVGAVPFLHRIHPDPFDHFRFTEDSLGRALRDAGFSELLVEPVGFGPITAGVSQFSRLFKIKRLVFLVVVAAITLDRLLQRIFPDNPNIQARNFPLVYFFQCRK